MNVEDYRVSVQLRSPDGFHRVWIVRCVCDPLPLTSADTLSVAHNLANKHANRCPTLHFARCVADLETEVDELRAEVAGADDELWTDRRTPEEAALFLAARRHGAAISALVALAYARSLETETEETPND